jgi:electron transport complex protein RnfD
VREQQRRIFPYKPQTNISFPSMGRMWLVSGCAFAAIFQSALGDGGRSLILAVVLLYCAILTEFLLTWRDHGTAKVKDGSAAVTALVLTLLLPNQINLVYAALGVIFAVTVVKNSFGGLGSNWLNPALGGWLFMRFSWPSAFSSAFANSAMSSTSQLSVMDNTITESLNHYVFSLFGVQMPSGYIDLFFNNNPGMIADRGIFFLLVSTIVITALGINRGWIPLVFLSVYGFLIRAADSFSGGDLLYGIFSGGTIAVAFIIAAEPSSSAKLKQGILFNVVLGAVLSWFFRYVCHEYSGCFIAVALVNCFTPAIKLAEDKLFILYMNRDKFTENIL